MFILSSCCCGLAHEVGLEMRALLGGEGGIIRLNQVQVLDDGTVSTSFRPFSSQLIGIQMDMSNALTTMNNFDLPESSSTPWVSVIF